MRKLAKGHRYKCYFVSGGGTEYDEGLWEVKTSTEKTLIVEKITDNGIYGTYEKGEKITCRKGNGNPVLDWDDNGFTIYPNQGGTPFVFESYNFRLF